MKTKTYPHVTGLFGDNGENPGALAIHAVLDPSPNYPESGRIIVGSPATTPTVPGYIPNLGGFNGGPAAIERLASTLLEAARDARAAMGEPMPNLDLQHIEHIATTALELLRAHGSTTRMCEATLALIARIRLQEAEIARLAARAKSADTLEHRMATLQPLANAATAFVDEQGKTADEYGLPRADDFATERWCDLVRAVKGNRR